MPTCPEYTVQIITYDPLQPKIYKCMTGAEQDAYRAQVYQERHGNDGVALAIIGVFMLVVAVSIFITARKA
jgi:hypothetical protein